MSINKNKKVNTLKKSQLRPYLTVHYEAISSRQLLTNVINMYAVAVVKMIIYAFS